MGAAVLILGGSLGFATLSKERKKYIFKVLAIIVVVYGSLYCLLRLSIGILNRYYLDNPEAPLF
jgi:hypothetical protein